MVSGSAQSMKHKEHYKWEKVSYLANIFKIHYFFYNSFLLNCSIVVWACKSSTIPVSCVVSIR